MNTHLSAALNAVPRSQSSSVLPETQVSPAMPPVIPPITGISPNNDRRPISEKISLDEIFSGSGINLDNSGLLLVFL